MIAEIVDYDLDRTAQREAVSFEVAVNDGEPLELTAMETEEYSGTFTREVDTGTGPDPNRVMVKPGDCITIRYHDTQNTFPGHAVPRESFVYVNAPTKGQIRILESRCITSDPNAGTPQRRRAGQPTTS